MTFPSPNKGVGRQCPPPPPSSPADVRRRRSSGMETDHPQQHHQRHQQHQPPPPPQQRIASLLQYAQTSYTTNPTDALSALMDALTVSTGTDAAAQVAMDRIRSELGDTVADCVSRNASNRHHPHSSQQQQQQHHHQQQSAQQHSYESAGQLSEREMTLRAMEVVQRMLDDTSTILHAQGRQHLLQQAMEDGSSVVCSKCGDMVARDRWRHHAEYWCRVIEEEKSCDGGEDMAMDD